MLTQLLWTHHLIIVGRTKTVRRCEVYARPAWASGGARLKFVGSYCLRFLFDLLWAMNSSRSS